MKVFRRRPSQTPPVSLAKTVTICLAFSAFLQVGGARAQKGGPPPQLPASSRIHTVSLPGNGFATETFDIADGKDSRVELTNCTSGAAPVLRVFQTFQTSQPQEIERAAATAVYFVAGSTPEALLVHAEDATSAGTCDWSAAFANYLSGSSGTFFWQTVASGTLSFGGATIRVEVRQDDRVHAGYSRVGADNLEMLITPASLAAPALQPPEFDSVGRRSPNDVHFHAFGLLPSQVPSAELFVIVGTPAPSGGKMRILVNDEFGTDVDGDGLGSEFESALGTCDDAVATLASGWPCWTNDPTNTDGDVLSDYEEIFGAIDSSDTLPFGWMGADPARRDAFLLRDWDPQVPVGPTATFTTLYARSLALQEFAGMVRALEVEDTINMHPNGDYGLYVHLEIDGSPGTGPIGTDVPSDHLTTFDLGGSTQTSINVGAAQGAQTAAASGGLSSLRQQYFRYQVAFGGQGSGTGFAPGQFSAYTTNRASRAHDGLHEFGHNFGIEHGGSFGVQNLKMNYFSLMSYRFQFSIDQSVNPQYPTVGFSVGNGAQIDQHEICESDGLGFSGRQDHLDFLSSAGTSLPNTLAPGLVSSAGLDVVGGIDWNRDGAISNCARPVEYSIQRASPGEISTGNQYRQLDVDTLTSSGDSADISIAWVDDTIPELYLVFSSSDDIFYRSVNYSGACTNPNEGDTVCLSWQAEADSGLDADSVTALGVSGKLWLVTRQSGRIFFRIGSFSGGFPSPSGNSATNAIGTVSAVQFGDEVRVFWLDTNSDVWEQAISIPNEAWVGQPERVSIGGVDVNSNVSPTAVVVAEDDLLLATTDSSNAVVFAEELSVGGGWTASSTYGDWEGAPPITDRPIGLTWRPDHRTRLDDSGYLIVGYRDSASAVVKLRFHRGLGSDSINRTELPINITDSATVQAGSGLSRVALYYPPGQRNALGLTQSQIGTLRFFPKVDGIGDAKLDATDDFARFAACIGDLSTSCDVTGLLPSEPSEILPPGSR